MNKTPKPVDGADGKEVEAAPLLETEERSHWAGSEETRTKKSSAEVEVDKGCRLK